MRRIIIQGMPFVFLAASLSACSDSNSGGDDPGRHAVSLIVNSVVVTGTCDEFPVDVDGGEWSYRVQVRFPGEANIVVGSTSSYPSSASHLNVGVGGTLTLDQGARFQTRTIEDAEGTEVVLRIAATEWDFDILGNNPAADPRMNDRSEQRIFTFSDGSWHNDPSGTLVVQNTNACRAVLNYSFGAVAE